MCSFAKVRDKLVFSLMVIDGVQRSAYQSLEGRFEKEHPNIDIFFEGYEQENYKKKIDDFLGKKTRTDIMFWFSGYKLTHYVNQGLVENIAHTWESENLDKEFDQSLKNSVSVAGEPYGIPIHLYQWGIYYKKSVFKKHGLKAPTNWNEFEKVCEKLKSVGISPITVSSKDGWPLLGWFDYLNLRMNGLKFHMDLMIGNVSYLDQKVHLVFEKLVYMIKKKYFIKQHENLNWRKALPFLYRERAGMLLMGNFWSHLIPKTLENEIDFVRFPIINSNVEYFEEMPLDILMIPKNSRNKNNAKKFLAFMSRPDIQEELNAKVKMLPPNKRSRIIQSKGNDSLNSIHFLKKGKEMLSSSKGFSQFFDRDAKPEIAELMIESLRTLFKAPDTPIKGLLDKLEKKRLKIY